MGMRGLTENKTDGPRDGPTLHLTDEDPSYSDYTTGKKYSMIDQLSIFYCQEMKNK